MKEISKKNYLTETEDNPNNEGSGYSLSKRSLTRKYRNSGYLMKIMNDIYYCDSETYFMANPQKFKK